MSPFRLLPLAALLLASGCAYDSYAQGYAPSGSYGDGYDQQDGYDQGYGGEQGFEYAETNVPSVEVFYDRLAPYGRWIDSRHGRVWSPNVDRDWRPYTLGRWGEDRYWISDEPFGWATYHYGRWSFDARDGWLWIPGTEWAPSWVAWRDADDYAGWAPLPPGLSVSVGVGFGYGYDNYNSWYEPSWVWVPRPYLYQPRFGGRIVRWDRGRDFWGRSRWQPRPEWRGRPGNWQGHGRYDRNDRAGWNGRPGANRPVPNMWQGRPNGSGNWQGGARGERRDERPDGWQGRPRGERQDGRPDGWQGRPRGEDRKIPDNWQGRRNTGIRPDGIRQDGNQAGTRPDGNPAWQGRRGDGVASGGGNPAWQGRQGYGNRQGGVNPAAPAGVNPAARPERQGWNGGQGRGGGPAFQQRQAAPPQPAPQPQAAPPPRAEPRQSPQREIGERNRPQ